MRLYHKLDIDNFEDIRAELEAATDERFKKSKVMWWNPPNVEWIQENCPLAHKWVTENINLPIWFYRFQITLPNDELVPHIDGTKEKPRIYTLNFPIMRKYNSTMTWYKYDTDNWETQPISLGGKLGHNAKAGVPLDMSKLEISEQIIVDRPTLLRTDIPHSLQNYNDQYRSVLSVRFDYHDPSLDLKDLLIC